MMNFILLFKNINKDEKNKILKVFITKQFEDGVLGDIIDEE